MCHSLHYRATETNFLDHDIRVEYKRLKTSRLSIPVWPFGTRFGTNSLWMILLPSQNVMNIVLIFDGTFRNFLANGEFFDSTFDHSSMCVEHILHRLLFSRNPREEWYESLHLQCSKALPSFSGVRPETWPCCMFFIFQRFSFYTFKETFMSQEINWSKCMYLCSMYS